MSNLNNAASSVGSIVSKCVSNRFPVGPLPIISVVTAALPVVPVVVLGSLAAYAARSLVRRLFE